MAADHNDDPKDLHSLGAKLLWVEKDENIQKMIKALAIFCAVLFLADFIAHRHPHFDIEGYYGFYAVYGFIAFAFIVIATKYLKRVIGRREDYYAPSAVDAEPYPDEGLGVKGHKDA